MRKIAFLIVSLISAGRLGSAATACANGTLADYIALSAGCTIGGNTLSDFAVATGSADSTAMAPSAILLSPAGGLFDPTLKTSVSVTAPAGSILEATFTFTISGNPYGSSSIVLSNSSETGDGAVTGLQDFCGGMAFGPDGSCSGTPGSLATLDGIQNQDSATFIPVSLLGVMNDLTVDGGSAGSASAGDLTDRFTAVPEPTSISLITASLILVLAFPPRRASAKSVPR
jgi:hypothetical protein